ncbi:MAG: efflux RND transporter permease subunit [Sandaracinaceae bacterium]
MPDATVVPRALEQGPPVDAPVEVRLIGHDLAALHLASEEVRRIVRSTEHAIDVRSDHGPGTPRLAFSVDEADAARRGVSSVEVAGALLASTHGRALSTYRGGDDPIPIVVRSPEAERRDAASLDAVAVRDVPVGAVTRRALRFGPAVVRHLDRRRTVSVLAEVQPGATYASIVAEITPQLEALDLPDGVRWELGGAAQSSGDANAGLGSGAPLGAVLLIAILLATFDSIRKVGVVLVTAPLAVMGIWPGLLLAGLPFGFVALLGAIALIGIVVNGAIVLIDLTEQRQGEGASMAEALTDAVTRRTRPILLTTATTVAGLTPLLFSDSTLWPPMASAMISGLIVATALTLFAVPALMRLLFRDPSPKAPTVALAAVALTLGLAAGNPTAEAQLLSHEEGGVTSAEVAVRALENDPSQVAVDASIAAAQTRVTQVWAGLLPTLRMSGRYTRLSEQENDPIVAGLGGGEETDALVSRLDDPAAQALWTGSLSQQRALGQAGIPVIVDQFVFEATLDVPISELFFTLVPQLEAAERGVDVERAAREVAQQTTALRAREVYYGLARARALEALATSRVADAQETLRVVEAAAELGAARESEVLGARARLAEVESFVWQAQAGTEAAAEAVRVLAAIEGPISLGEDLEQALPAPAALARLQEEAWTGRAEVRVLRRAMGVSERVQAAAEGARYPALRVRLGAQAANPNARFVPPRASFDATWDVSVLLAWSPNAAVAAEARASEASAARARLTAQLEQLRRGLRLEVTGAWSQDRAAQAVLVGVRAQRDASAEALRSRQAERREGTATTQEVLDAEASATAARLTWVNAVIGARLARARLAYASAGAVPWP